MQHDAITQTSTQSAKTRHRLGRGALAAAIAAGASLAMALAGAQPASADDDRSRRCSNRTLRGDYGLLVSGVRGIGPGATETFIASVLRSYDGNGGFTQVDNIHGQTTEAVRNQPAHGTYDVGADCTGSAFIFFPGAPFPIETAFVIVENGKEVREIVMTPQPNLATAVGRRVR
jgi:hypothetical protein